MTNSRYCVQQYDRLKVTDNQHYIDTPGYNTKHCELHVTKRKELEAYISD